MSPTLTPVQASSSVPLDPPLSDPLHLPPDPLLDSESYIHGEPSLADGGRRQTEAPKPEGAAKTDNDPDPSMETPTNGSTADQKSRRRSVTTESWLPPGWIVEDRVRSSGATAGSVDKYYFDPSSKRRFRSKIEVLYFLEHGTLPPKKKKKTEGGDTTSDTAESTPRSKPRKAVSSRRVLKFDFQNPPSVVSWVLTDPLGDSWAPFTGEKKISDTASQDWAAAFMIASTKNSDRSAF